MITTVEDILDLLQRRGHSQYGGECVTQLEHALQCAALAESEAAPAALISAALLHDVGHLIHDLPVDAPDQCIDDHHESAAANYLRKLFPAEVLEPIRLHVAAKRYLCAVDPDYLTALSEPSLVSLQIQGGAMSPAEATQFQAHPFAADAVRLRRWDDAAKIPSLPTPSLAHFAGYLRQAGLEGGGA